MTSRPPGKRELQGEDVKAAQEELVAQGLASRQVMLQARSKLQQALAAAQQGGDLDAASLLQNINSCYEVNIKLCMKLAKIFKKMQTPRTAVVIICLSIGKGAMILQHQQATFLMEAIAAHAYEAALRIVHRVLGNTIHTGTISAGVEDYVDQFEVAPMWMLVMIDRIARDMRDLRSQLNMLAPLAGLQGEQFAKAAGRLSPCDEAYMTQRGAILKGSLRALRKISASLQGTPEAKRSIAQRAALLLLSPDVLADDSGVTMFETMVEVRDSDTGFMTEVLQPLFKIAGAMHGMALTMDTQSHAHCPIDLQAIAVNVSELLGKPRITALEDTAALVEAVFAVRAVARTAEPTGAAFEEAHGFFFDEFVHSFAQLEATARGAYAVSPLAQAPLKGAAQFVVRVHAQRHSYDDQDSALIQQAELHKLPLTPWLMSSKARMERRAQAAVVEGRIANELADEQEKAATKVREAVGADPMGSVATARTDEDFNTISSKLWNCAIMAKSDPDALLDLINKEFSRRRSTEAARRSGAEAER